MILLSWIAFGLYLKSNGGGVLSTVLTMKDDILPRPIPRSFLKTDIFVAWRGTYSKLACVFKLIAAQLEVSVPVGSESKQSRCNRRGKGLKKGEDEQDL
jgi:hypothetical protein